MAKTERIAVIGSGMAGLACARRLADAGRAPVVFDQGRGIGGRLATRRTSDGLQFITRTDPDHPLLAWIAQDSSKPGRHAPACWVAQASATWSAAHLELSPDALATLLLPMLCDRLGTDASAVRYVAAHRRRYARVCVPFDRPFARDTSGTLYAGGDWCLGPRVEAAWSSGEAIARLMASMSSRAC